MQCTTHACLHHNCRSRSYEAGRGACGTCGRGTHHCAAAASSSVRCTALPRAAHQRTNARHSAAVPATSATPHLRAALAGSVLAASEARRSRDAASATAAAAGVGGPLQCARHDALLTTCKDGTGQVHVWDANMGRARTTKMYTHANACASMSDLEESRKGAQQQAAVVHRGRGGHNRRAGSTSVEVYQ